MPMGVDYGFGCQQRPGQGMSERFTGRPHLLTLIGFSSLDRFLDRLIQLGILLTGCTADALDLGELLLGKVDLAYGDIAFAQIFAGIGIVGIQSNRLLVISNSLGEVTELAVGITQAVQHLGIVLVNNRAEQESPGFKITTVSESPSLRYDFCIR